MISSTIKGPAFFIFFKTKKESGGTLKARRDVISLQIAQAFRRRDLEDEQARLAELAKIDTQEIQPLKFRAEMIRPEFIQIEQRISELEIEIEDLDVEIEAVRKDDALAIVLIMALL